LPSKPFLSSFHVSPLPRTSRIFLFVTFAGLQLLTAASLPPSPGTTIIPTTKLSLFPSGSNFSHGLQFSPRLASRVSTFLFIPSTFFPPHPPPPCCDIGPAPPRPGTLSLIRHSLPLNHLFVFLFFLFIFGSRVKGLVFCFRAPGSYFVFGVELPSLSLFGVLLNVADARVPGRCPHIFFPCTISVRLSCSHGTRPPFHWDGHVGVLMDVAWVN